MDAFFDQGNLVDMGIVVILAYTTLLGLLRGAALEILSVAGWAAAVVAGFALRPVLTHYWGGGYLDSVGEVTQPVLFWAIPFVIAKALFYFIAEELAPYLRAVLFSYADRPLGLLLGAGKGAGFVVVVYVLVVAAVRGEDGLPYIVRNSYSFDTMRSVASVVGGYFPDRFSVYVVREQPPEKPGAPVEAGDAAEPMQGSGAFKFDTADPWFGSA